MDFLKKTRSINFKFGAYEFFDKLEISKDYKIILKNFWLELSF